MVLDVFVEGCDDYMSCQYSGFYKFRCEILRGWNEELGKLYEQKYFYEKNMNKMKKILNEYDKPYNEGMKLFFFHSDCDGEFTPAECKLLLKSFEHVDPDKFDNSDKETNSWLKESFEKWINMIKYAIVNNKNIIFA